MGVFEGQRRESFWYLCLYLFWSFHSSTQGEYRRNNFPTGERKRPKNRVFCFLSFIWSKTPGLREQILTLLHFVKFEFARKLPENKISFITLDFISKLCKFV